MANQCNVICIKMFSVTCYSAKCFHQCKVCQLWILPRYFEDNKKGHSLIELPLYAWGRYDQKSIADIGCQYVKIVVELNASIEIKDE